MLLSDLKIPGVFFQELLRLTIVPARQRSRPHRVLDLCLRGQPIARQSQVVLLELDDRGLALERDQIAPLLLRNALLLTQPITVFRRQRPRGHDNRATWFWGIPCRVHGPWAESEVLRNRDRLRAKSKRPGDPPRVLEFLTFVPTHFGSGRSH